MNRKMMKGFTLVEIMIVVAIIAILAAIAIPNFVKYRNESQKNACISNQSSIKTAMENWAAEPKNAGKTPKEDDIAPSTGDGYLKTLPVCPKTGKSYTLGKDETTGAMTATCDDGTHVVETADGSSESGT